MKTRLSIAALGILGSIFAHAQNVVEEPIADPVLDAIHEFKTRDKNKPNEVTVVLEPEPAPSVPKDKKPGPDAITKPTEKPIEDKPLEASDIPKTQAPQDTVTVKPDEVSPQPEPGLAVRVENLKTGKGTIDSSKIKLLAPFPAKPLSQAPAGWHLDASTTAPPFTREVEIAPGSKITLTIRPHLLIPDADGARIFSVSEPGYENALGYQQTATVGAILSSSIQRMDEESKQMGAVIDRLQQLLISLPKPETQPVIEPVKPVPSRKK
jgi:hypothetical protein